MPTGGQAGGRQEHLEAYDATLALFPVALQPLDPRRGTGRASAWR